MRMSIAHAAGLNSFHLYYIDHQQAKGREAGTAGHFDSGECQVPTNNKEMIVFGEVGDHMQEKCETNETEIEAGKTALAVDHQDDAEDACLRQKNRPGRRRDSLRMSAVLVFVNGVNRRRSLRRAMVCTCLFLPDICSSLIRLPADFISYPCIQSHCGQTHQQDYGRNKWTCKRLYHWQSNSRQNCAERLIRWR